MAALERDAPTALVLSRQDLPVLDPNLSDVRGAVVATGDDVAILASGSEVEVPLAAREILAEEGIGARVVSIASFELFLDRPQDERERIIPPAMPRLAVEAATPFGWCTFTSTVIGMTGFGASRKAADLYQMFGITSEAVAGAARGVLTGRAGDLPNPAGSGDGRAKG